MESTVHLMALTGIAMQRSQLQARAEKELRWLAGPQLEHGCWWCQHRGLLLQGLIGKEHGHVRELRA